MMVKRRSLLVQILLMTVTVGMYSIYWYYATTREILGLLKRDEENVFLWTILFVIPILFCISYYKQGKAYEELTGGELNRWVLFALWILFPPLVWIIVQRRLNEVADAQLAVASGQPPQLNA